MILFYNNKNKKYKLKYLFTLILFLNLFSSEKELLENKIKSFKKLINLTVNPKMRSFLNIISICEGTEVTLFKDIPENPNFNFELYENELKKNEVYPASIDSYKIQFGYKKFDNFKNHPKKIIKIKNLRSSAAGRYQILQKTYDEFYKNFEPWIELKKNKEIKNSLEKAFKELTIYYKNYKKDFKSYKNSSDLLSEKFGPFMQDLCAINLIQKAGATKLILEKKYQKAIKKTAKIWASFPFLDSEKSFYKNQKSQKKYFIEKICNLTKNAFKDEFNLRKIFNESKNIIKNFYEKNLKNKKKNNIGVKKS